MGKHPGRKVYCPWKVVMSPIRNQAEQAMRSKPKSSVPTMVSACVLLIIDFSVKVDSFLQKLLLVMAFYYSKRSPHYDTMLLI